MLIHVFASLKKESCRRLAKLTPNHLLKLLTSLDLVMVGVMNEKDRIKGDWEKVAKLAYSRLVIRVFKQP